MAVPVCLAVRLLACISRELWSAVRQYTMWLRHFLLHLYERQVGHRGAVVKLLVVNVATTKLMIRAYNCTVIAKAALCYRRNGSRLTGGPVSVREWRRTVQNDERGSEWQGCLWRGSSDHRGGCASAHRQRRQAAEIAAETVRRPPDPDADEGTLHTAPLASLAAQPADSLWWLPFLSLYVHLPSVVTLFSLLCPNFLRVAILLD